LLIRLHYAQELRNPQAYFEDITDGQVPKDQLQLAEQLLKNKTAPFDPLLFKDRYQDSLLEVIKATRSKELNHRLLWRKNACRF